MFRKIAQQQDRGQIVVDRHQHQRGVGPGPSFDGQGGGQGGTIQSTGQVAHGARHVVGHFSRSKTP